MGKILLKYASKGGDLSIEKIREPSENTIEMADGDHPLTNDSFWQDENRRMNPVVFIIQGVRAPYGGTMEQDDIKRVLFDLDLSERTFRPPAVSKMWSRAFERMGEWLLKFLPILIMGAIIVWALYESMMGGF